MRTEPRPPLERLVQPLWDYLAVSASPRAVDAIFVFGCADHAVPARAAELYHQGHAPVTLVSGSYGRLTRGVFPKPEAHVFRDELVRAGVPAASIVAEPVASNTLENVRFGVAALEKRGLRPVSALLVAKGFVMRRCVATFARQYPDINVYACPPQAQLRLALDRSLPELAARLVAEIERLDRYADQGDIRRQQIPPEVRAAAAAVTAALRRGLGVTRA